MPIYSSDQDPGKQAQLQSLFFRHRYANVALVAMLVQLAVANVVFIWYAFAIHWRIPTAAIDAWLAAAVVQVIGVVLVITKHLFPAAPTVARTAPPGTANDLVSS